MATFDGIIEPQFLGKQQASEPDSSSLEIMGAHVNPSNIARSAQLVLRSVHLAKAPMVLPSLNLINVYHVNGVTLDIVECSAERSLLFADLLSLPDRWARLWRAYG